MSGELKNYVLCGSVLKLEMIAIEHKLWKAEQVVPQEWFLYFETHTMVLRKYLV